MHEHEHVTHDGHAPSAAPWIRPLNRCADPSARLICFPHAGGTASFFRTWRDAVPEGVELAAVCYPGREDRLADPFAATMEHLVGPLTRACSRYRDRPLVFFGHSMGASVAYEVALRLETEYGISLAALAVSSRHAPGRQEQNRSLGDADDSQLIEHVALLGGTQTEVLACPELRELVLPPIRADYRLIGAYEASRGVLTCPVVAYWGEEDTDVPQSAVRGWSAVTRAAFATRSFGGGHFYLADHARDIVDDLHDRALPTDTSRRGIAGSREGLPCPSE